MVARPSGVTRRRDSLPGNANGAVRTLDVARHGARATSDRLIEIVDSFCRRHRLSHRETQVVSLAAVGLSSKDIAGVIECTPATVDVYWTRLYAKTGCRSHVGVVACLLEVATAPPMATAFQGGSRRRL
jgi:DNA-binding CsgD family transcriptional regulator